MQNVQIVQFEATKFLLPGGQYHIGYFGTCARFFSLIDPIPLIHVFRDMNKPLKQCDKLSMDKFIDTDYLLHFYYTSSYYPEHCQSVKRAKRYNPDEIFLKGCTLAGLWACKKLSDFERKELFDEMFEQFNCNMSDSLEDILKCYKLLEKFEIFKHPRAARNYGIDEQITNGSLMLFARDKRILWQPILDLESLLWCIKPEYVELFCNTFKQKVKDLLLKTTFVDLTNIKLERYDFSEIITYCSDNADMAKVIVEVLVEIGRTDIFDASLSHEPSYVDEINDFIQSGNIHTMVVWIYILAPTKEIRVLFDDKLVSDDFILNFIEKELNSLPMGPQVVLRKYALDISKGVSTGGNVYALKRLLYENARRTCSNYPEHIEK